MYDQIKKFLHYKIALSPLPILLFKSICFWTSKFENMHDFESSIGTIRHISQFNMYEYKLGDMPYASKLLHYNKAYTLIQLVMQ